MNELKIGGRLEKIMLNNHMVRIITPKESISYEEFVKRVDKILSKAKKR